MDNGGVGRFADGRCPGHRSSVHGKGDGKRGGGGEEKAPSNQGSSNPNVRISVEERRALVVPGTENKVPGTIHSEAPPRQIRAASPSPLLPLLPTFVNVSSHKRADGNRESSTSWLMMLHVALSAYIGEYV